MNQINSSTGVLNGRVAIVTGVSSGLGRATALALAKAGARVALVARTEDELVAVATEIETAGGRALVLPLDLAQGNEIMAVAQRTIEAFDRVDILVNAAGTDVPASIVDLTLEQWDRVLNVNLRASFLLAKAVFPHMRQLGHGTIVNISSVAGKRGWANAGAYCASKFGLTGLTQALAAEGRAYGIRACVLYPGGMATNWGDWSQATSEQRQPEPLPATKALPPAEVAALIVWIAAAPKELVLNEVIIAPLQETGWP
jgi:NAD(P)-dependent dehydrogenase (short-subunit alcohol dehydrogenase family)